MNSTALTNTRGDCRLCGSTNVTTILKLPACPPVDNYRYASESDRLLPAFPMDLSICKKCGHAQLLDVVDPNVLFGNYIYTSTSSPDLDSHFSSYCDKISTRFSWPTDSLVIDVGSNDGLLLKKFQELGWRVQGVDPAAKVADVAIAAGVPTFVSFLNEEAVAKLLTSCGSADLVTANNVFSHADDLRGFTVCVRNLLKPQGIFVFEVSYLLDLVQGKVFDYIYHEHLAHHSVAPLRRFFESVGMRLFDVERVQTKGGSIRCFACRQDASWEVNAVIDELVSLEQNTGLYDLATYESLRLFIDELGDRTRKTIDSIAGSGPVAAYGASATSTVILHSLGLTERLSYLIDDNPERQGRLCPGTSCPVLPRQCLTDKRPAITFIAAWRFANLIISKNAEYLNRGGAFLVPLPEFRVVRC